MNAPNSASVVPAAAAFNKAAATAGATSATLNADDAANDECVFDPTKIDADNRDLIQASVIQSGSCSLTTFSDSGKPRLAVGSTFAAFYLLAAPIAPGDESGLSST